MMIGLEDTARFAKRAVRALRKKELWQAAQIKCPRIKLGKEGACWCVYRQDLRGSSVVYSLGVGEDISLALALIERLRLRGAAFDPSPPPIQCLTRPPAPQQSA